MFFRLWSFIISRMVTKLLKDGHWLSKEVRYQSQDGHPPYTEWLPTIPNTQWCKPTYKELSPTIPRIVISQSPLTPIIPWSVIHSSHHPKNAEWYLWKKFFFVQSVFCKILFVLIDFCAYRKLILLQCMLGTDPFPHAQTGGLLELLSLIKNQSPLKYLF